MFSSPETDQILKDILDNHFSYYLKVTVPNGLEVVNPGILDQKESSGDIETFTYSSISPSQYIAFSVAPYRIVKDESVTLYLFPESIRSGQWVLQQLKDCYDYYSKYLRNREPNGCLQIIEIPQGYGSFAGANFIFQEGKWMSDKQYLQGLYHEYAHVLFSVKAEGAVQQSRFFDEAIAQYLSAKAVESLQGEERFQELMISWLNSFLAGVENDNKISLIPLTEYGVYDLGHLSYLVGPWILFMLEK